MSSPNSYDFKSGSGTPLSPNNQPQFQQPYSGPINVTIRPDGEVIWHDDEYFATLMPEITELFNQENDDDEWIDIDDSINPTTNPPTDVNNSPNSQAELESNMWNDDDDLFAALITELEQPVTQHNDSGYYDLADQ